MTDASSQFSEQPFRQFPGIDSLSMDDIIEWVGEKVAPRGVDYQRKKKVRDLALTADGFLLANVDGTYAYAVAVFRKSNGRMTSHCTCPYGWNCKHAVAALLEYVEHIKNGLAVAPVTANDARTVLFSDAFTELPESHMYDDMPVLESNPYLESGKISAKVQSYLSAMTKEALLCALYEAMVKVPEVHAIFESKVNTLTADVTLLLKNFRKALKDGCQGGDYDSWSDSVVPDFSAAREIMALFIESDNEDVLLEEITPFLELLDEQMNSATDDWETGDEFQQCLFMFLTALRTSKRNHAEKMIWALEVIFIEDYGLAEDFEKFLNEKHSEADWDIVAEYLEEHLASKADSLSAYIRGKVITWLSIALDGAGRGDEIIPFYEKRALVTNDYERLVLQCMREKKFDKALQWISQGLEVKDGNAATSLKSLRREIYELQGDWTSLLREEVVLLVQTPSAPHFMACLRTAAKLDPTPAFTSAVRTCLLSYLAEGTLPWKCSAWPSNFEIAPNIPNTRETFPNVYALVHIAIEEKNGDDVLHWYKRIPKGSNYDRSFFHAIALALQEKHADVAVTLWKKLAENTISLATKRAYATARIYLQKMHKCLLAQNLLEEWETYAAYLRGKHARKKLFIAVLDTIDSTALVKK